jgi:hypothetical protein
MTSHASASSAPRSVSTEAFGFAELEVASNSMLKMVQNSVLSIRAATKVLPLLTCYLVNFHTHILMQPPRLKAENELKILLKALRKP